MRVRSFEQNMALMPDGMAKKIMLKIINTPRPLVSETPEFFLCITRIRESISANSSQIIPDRSLLPSSISNISISLYSCSIQETTHLLIYFSALYTGIIIVTKDNPPLRGTIAFVPGFIVFILPSLLYSVNFPLPFYKYPLQ